MLQTSQPGFSYCQGALEKRLGLRCHPLRQVGFAEGLEIFGLKASWAGGLDLIAKGREGSDGILRVAYAQIDLRVGIRRSLLYAVITARSLGRASRWALAVCRVSRAA